MHRLRTLIDGLWWSCRWPTAVLALVACGLPAEAATAPPQPTTAPQAAAPVIEAATAHTTAVRLSPPTTTAPPVPVGAEPFMDCAAYIDALPWEWRNPEPGRLAYRAGAACRGWPADVIDRWERFVVDDVWAGESGWCWNLLGGGQIATNVGCVMGRVGSGEDAGVGQLTSAWWGRNGRVCLDLGYCSRADVIASPYTSVMAALYAIEVAGDQAYCYDARSRAYHPTCRDYPSSWP